ncbi:glycosyltransferase family 2 protein [Anabaena sp. UHCC 0399]|uniref:glycosyltransferase family 2 protein n=1 Tax=Anabaena sp. UHCC 0399 TaxID=3110238 RepID=UPI002B2214B5|nr:glycosyltransferase family 2 protein [Anabaena sp. UHCC 0399]MEA5567050.1 glycosyltransferase family 2 protein [Anabaena sp. UHCC 0399]
MLKVSVIIPAYNAMQYLPETVSSVFQQTFTNFEILIINDGSSDNIQEWVLNLTDKRVKLISQQNQGVSVARNTGISQAQGEYIAFVDADDLWDATKLEKQVSFLDNNPTIGLVHSWMAVIDEQGKPTGRIMASDTEGSAWKQLVEKNTVACSSVMVRRLCFQTVEGFSPRQNEYPVDVEDWEMWIRIAAHYPFAVIKEPLIFYRQHISNTSKNWQSLEKAYRIVIEKAFHTAPPELLYLKNRSYGYANLRLAWKCLQNRDRDYKQALNFRQQALIHYPQLRYCWEYIRLSLAVMALQLFGANIYTKVLKLIYTLRRHLSSLGKESFIYSWIKIK